MLVSVLIPSSLLLDACFQSSRQIDPRLVRKADELIERIKRKRAEKREEE